MKISAMSPPPAAPTAPMTVGFAAGSTAADPRWQQVQARDAAADGQFFYAVTTTGVYCRPSCASRQARPEHVVFYATQDEARAAGFRPCRRCKPEQLPLATRHAAKVIVACRIIENAETLPKLATLAAQVGLSAHHFHRIFKAVTGLTPRAYAAAQRAQSLRQHLPGAATVTAAIVDAGYGSNSRFYEQADALLGMRPESYRDGGLDHDIRYTLGTCSLGTVLVAESARGICAIQLGDDAEDLVAALQRRFAKARLSTGDAELAMRLAQVLALIEGPTQPVELPLDVRGTVFQQRVWQALREIPAGHTASYAEVAQRIGAPKAVRAVAQACAANELAVAIPCHRVVRSDGSLSGYRWGGERKKALLRRESQS